MTKSIALIAALALCTIPLSAQKPAAVKEPIADNSFLMEEAYNQEPGVVQHISVFSKITGQQAWSYSFTQEWPFRGQRHQLSYTVPLMNTGEGGSSGIGDLMLNYRLQAIFDEETGLAFSPRLSVSMPTGDKNNGLGVGALGWQVNLPVSKMLGSSVVSHSNAGATWFSSAPSVGKDASMHGLNLGQSLIWLATPRFNVMLEAVWSRTTTTLGGHDASVENAFVSPGIRWGYDFKSGLQVVPGIAFPIGVGQSNGTKQVLLYVSFEHPFTKEAKATAK